MPIIRTIYGESFMDWGSGDTVVLTPVIEGRGGALVKRSNIPCNSEAEGGFDWSEERFVRGIFKNPTLRTHNESPGYQNDLSKVKYTNSQKREPVQAKYALQPNVFSTNVR
jgi:hypothetical protein